MVLEPRAVLTQRRASFSVLPGLSLPSLGGALGGGREDNLNMVFGAATSAFGSDTFGGGLQAGAFGGASGESPITRCESVPVSSRAVNDCFSLAPALHITGEWRGPLGVRVVVLQPACLCCLASVAILTHHTTPFTHTCVMFRRQTTAFVNFFASLVAFVWLSTVCSNVACSYCSLPRHTVRLV